MAKVKVNSSYTSGLYNSIFDDVSSEPTSYTTTSSAITFYFGSTQAYLQINGTGLKYDSQGVPNGGTITGFKGYYYGESVVISEASIPTTKFMDYALSYDDEGLEAYIFRSSDQMYGGDGGDLFEGFAGNDLLYGYAGNDYLYGDDGNDKLYGGDDSDQLYGGEGRDYLDGGSGYDYLYGNEGNDELYGGAEDDDLYGGEGSDYLDGGSGDDYLYGGSGNDILWGGAGSNRMYGGSGNDTYYVLSQSDSVIEYSNGGTDLVYSKLINYTLDSNVENAQINVSFSANLYGNYLNNTLYAGTGNNILDGRDGVDTVSYVNGASSGVTVDLSITTAQDTVGSGTDTLSSIERLHGSDFADNLTGTSSSNYLRGLGGSDRIDSGGSGNNTLIGDAGNDYLISGTGNDVLNGGTGTDSVSYYFDASEGVTAKLYVSSAQNTGGGGTDTLISIERLYGSNFNDKLYGNNDANYIRGYNGNDTLDGRGGNDTMRGDGGNDYYYVRDSGDVVQEFSSGGTDRVYSYLSNYTLGDHVEDARIMSSGTANLKGNSQSNFIYAGKGDNYIHGGGDYDSVSYLYGADSGVTAKLYITSTQATGGSGSDRLIAVENLYGSNYSDKLYGNDNTNYLRGYNGNDTLDGRGGNDTMRGDGGNDHYYVRENGDVVQEYSGGGTDRVNSYLSNYTLGNYVEQGRIMSTGTADLTGNSLNNFIYAGQGNNQIDGSSGSDSVSYLYGATTGVRVNLSISTAQNTIGSGTDTLTSIERLYGSNYSDKLYGSTSSNYLRGLGGNDRIDSGGSGNNSLIGDAGNDFLISGTGNDLINGGSGTDSVSYYYYANAGVNVKLYDTSAQDTGGAGTDTLISIERLYGSNFNDRLYGNDDANYLRGYNGTDTLDGRGGNDTMRGDGGNDYYYVRDNGDVVQEFSGGGTDRVYSYLSNYTLGDHVEDGRIVSSKAASLTGNDLDNFIYAGKGDNVIDAGTGDDSVSYLYGASSGVTVSLGTNLAQSTNGSGEDQLVSVENLYGSNFDDVLTGNDDVNTLRGHNGNDTLNGGDGNDILIGDLGNDLIFGDLGADLLEGGDGQDTFIFSQGDSPAITYDGIDTFTALNGLDVISDFNDGDDSIDLSSIDFSNVFSGTAQDQNVSIVDGDWDGTEFVVSNAGSDALVVYDGDASASANFTGVVLSDVDVSLLQIVSSDDGITIS